MGHFQGALICAVAATLFWGGIGLSVASWLPVPQALRTPLAPTLGWAVHSILALSLFLLTGMTSLTVWIVAGLAAAAAAAAFWKRPRYPNDDPKQVGLPSWALIGAIVLACVMMLPVLPKFSEQGVALAQPIFDHAKVAIIDDIARLGVPAGNPFFEEAGGFGRLFYYYLWHFSAAELSVLTGFTGWQADAGLTGFTALCSLLLMTGFAVWISGRGRSALWALVLAATSSIRPIVTPLLGWDNTAAAIGDPSGFGTWLFQMSWAPQHVGSANCVVIAVFLIVRLAQRRDVLLAIVLGLVAAAAFSSSTWVGGVTFPLAAIAIMPMLLSRSRSFALGRFAALLALAAVLAAVLVTPLMIEQLKGSALRGDGFPIAVASFNPLGERFSLAIRLPLDIALYWTAFLFVEFAAVYPAGLLMAAWLAKDPLLTPERRTAIAALVALAVVGLAVGGLLKSTTALNNDLAWRAVLPSLLVLGGITAAGLGRYGQKMQPVVLAPLLLLVSLTFSIGLFDTYRNIAVKPSPAARKFLQSEAMWAAVRAHTGISERVANNPDFLREMTKWPVNISWALLANRRSCYAGPDLALPFAPLTKQGRDEADALFRRIFAGTAKDDDVARMRDTYTCDVVVLTPDDGAWTKDDLIRNGDYRLVMTDPDWRIYRRTSGSL